MMNNSLCVALLIVASWSSAGCFSARNVHAQPPVLSLCQVVDDWKTYNGKAVRVRAIYSVGAEAAVLYDPGCYEDTKGGKNIRRLTVAELPDSASGKSELSSRVSKDRRAWVIVDGVFYGPELTKTSPAVPRDILPDWLKERLDASPRRYGHMGMFDSMFRVVRVIQVRKVGADVRW